MRDSKNASATPRQQGPSLGTVVSQVREVGGVDVAAGMSIRELARRSGVSAAQLSRIEAGQVLKPSREILVALGRALNRNPLPLLILAGHLMGAEACDALRPLFRNEAELPEEWGPWAVMPLDAVRSVLAEPDPSEADIRTIAADVFRVIETEETLWDESYALALARGSDAAELRELMSIWRFVGPRRSDLLAFGRSLRHLTDLEYRAEADASRVAAQIVNHPTTTNNQKEDS